MTEFQFDEILVDLQAGAVTRKGKPVPLSGREFQLLRVLIERRGHVLSRDQLQEQAWGGRAPDEPGRVVDNVVLRLRKKLEPDPRSPRHILSVYGQGYRFHP